MYHVRYKVHNAMQAWQTHGSYGDERSALSNASRIAEKYFMIQVTDPKGNVIWSK